MADPTRPETTLVRVRDGRRIAVSEFGAPDGTATMLYFHATTSSRIEGSLFDDAARQRGLRVVALDRPSAGRSDPLRRRRLVDWPHDVADVADELGIESFAVVGQSAGAPHALACAHALPDRVRTAVTINSLVPIAWNPELAVDALPHERFPLLARRATPVLRTVLRVWGLLLRPKTLTASRFARLLTLPESDRALLEDRELWELIVGSIREGTRQDRQIAMRELTLLYEREGWGFDPFSLRVPTVLFVGDQVGGLEFARRVVAGAPPGSRVETFAGGHMGNLAPSVRDRVVDAAA